MKIQQGNNTGKIYRFLPKSENHIDDKTYQNNIQYRPIYINQKKKKKTKIIIIINISKTNQKIKII